MIFFMNLFMCSYCRGNVVRKISKVEGLEKGYNGVGLTIERGKQIFITLQPLCLFHLLITFYPPKGLSLLSLYILVI